ALGLGLGLGGFLAQVGSHHFGMVAHLEGQALGEQLAEVEAVHVVADAHHQRHVVLDHQDGEVELLAQGQELVAQMVRLLRAHARPGLVQHEQVGSVARAVAISTRLSTPYGSPATGRSRRSPRLRISSKASARARSRRSSAMVLGRPTMPATGLYSMAACWAVSMLAST